MKLIPLINILWLLQKFLLISFYINMLVFCVSLSAVGLEAAVVDNGVTDSQARRTGQAKLM